MRGLDLVAVVLILLPPLDWLAAIILSNVSRKNPDILTLRHAAASAVLLAIAASLAGVVGFAVLRILTLPPGWAVGILACALVLLSAPSLVWLGLLALGRFRVDE